MLWYYLNMSKRSILVCFFLMRVYTSFFILFVSLTFFFGNDRARAWHYRQKNEYEEEQNQSFSLFFSCFFFYYTWNHMPHIPLHIFFFFFVFFMSVCRHVVHWCWFVYYTNITPSGFCYYYYHQESFFLMMKIMEYERVLT